VSGLLPRGNWGSVGQEYHAFSQLRDYARSGMGCRVEDLDVLKYTTEVRGKSTTNWIKTRCTRWSNLHLVKKSKKDFTRFMATKKLVKVFENSMAPRYYSLVYWIFRDLLENDHAEPKSDENFLVTTNKKPANDGQRLAFLLWKLRGRPKDVQLFSNPDEKSDSHTGFCRPVYEGDSKSIDSWRGSVRRTPGTTLRGSLRRCP